jgi:hypothetical protein
MRVEGEWRDATTNALLAFLKLSLLIIVLVLF